MSGRNLLATRKAPVRNRRPSAILLRPHRLEYWQATFLRIPLLPDLLLDREALFSRGFFRIFDRRFRLIHFVSQMIDSRFFAGVPPVGHLLK
jgi:hypothetical protein